MTANTAETIEDLDYAGRLTVYRLLLWLLTQEPDVDTPGLLMYLMGVATGAGLVQATGTEPYILGNACDSVRHTLMTLSSGVTVEQMFQMTGAQPENGEYAPPKPTSDDLLSLPEGFVIPEEYVEGA